jgi:hypothetical protein
MTLRGSVALMIQGVVALGPPVLSAAQTQPGPPID